jgi:glycosyltransferase involved in cell wall biosynthesis
MKRTYLLGVSTTWPPMAAGSGRAFKELVSGVEALVVLAPKAGGVVEDEPYVQRVLRFSGRGGGPLKIHSVLQHLEAVLAPAAWSIGSRRGRPGLVVSSQTLFSGVGALLLRLIWGIPYIVHAHGEEFTFALENDSVMRARYHLIKLVLDRAGAIVCNSRYTWHVLHSEYGVSQDRLHIIHPTVDIRERKVDHVRVHRLKQELVGTSQLLLMVGRLAEERKGFDKAIEALPLILTRVPDVKLVIAGPGDPTFLRLLAQQVGVEGHVVFVGELERKQLMLLYAACDVFLLPTRTMPTGDTEGFGIVFLEANLMGKPVVGGRAGGTEDAVVDGQTGLLVDGYDIEQIADAVVRVLDDPVYANLLGQQGKERVLREFDTRVHQQEFVDIANSILSSP